MDAIFYTFYLSMSIISMIVYPICTVLCIISIVRLDKNQKVPRAILGLNIGFSLGFVVYAALWITVYLGLPFAITIPLIQRLINIQSVGLAFLAISLVFYFVKFLFIIFSWIKIVATQVKYKGNIDRTRKIAISFLAIWISCGLLLGFLLGIFLQLIWLQVLGLVCVAMVPISMTVALIVYSLKMRGLLSKMLNVEKGQDMTRTITLLSIVYIVACNLHVVWLLLSIVKSLPEWTDFITFYFPQYLVCITTIWFLTPLRKRVHVTTSVTMPSTTHSTARSSTDSTGSGGSANRDFV